MEVIVVEDMMPLLDEGGSMVMALAVPPLPQSKPRTALHSPPANTCLRVISVVVVVVSLAVVGLVVFTIGSNKLYPEANK